MSKEVEPSGLTGEARERVAAELSRLQERRDRLEAEVRNDRGAVSDHADAADAIQRADELVGLDERLAELDRLLHAGPAPSNGDELPFGTVVKLKFSDGDVVTMQVISVIEEASIDSEAEALTASSPLGQALVGLGRHGGCGEAGERRDEQERADRHKGHLLWAGQAKAYPTFLSNPASVPEWEARPRRLTASPAL